MRRIVQALVVFAAAVLLGGAASAQTTLSGPVVAVIDGRTFVIDTERGRITGSVQYVDVPEPEQPLSRIVREHFERLVVGRSITFTPNGFSPAALVGKVYMDGLDMGQQLLRDGAAWHTPVDRSGQNPTEAGVYRKLEELARAEKRGVWSIANLTPAWEFRALKERTPQDTNFLQAAVRDHAAEDTKNYKYPGNNPDMWVEVGGDAFAQRNPAGPLFWGYDAATKVRNVSTPSIAQVLFNDREPIEVEVRVIYLQGEIRPRTANIAFVLGILATSREHNFAKDNVLKFSADGKEFAVGGGQRFYRENPLAVQELVQYRISSSDLQTMAAAKKLTVRFGASAGTVGSDLQLAIGQLLEGVK